MKALCVLLLCATASAQTPQQAIDALIAAPPFQRAIWGIDIENDDGGIVYQHNAGTLMIPASNRKIFAMAAAADCLGFDGRFATELWLGSGGVAVSLMTAGFWAAIACVCSALAR